MCIHVREAGATSCMLRYRDGDVALDDWCKLREDDGGRVARNCSVSVWRCRGARGRSRHSISSQHYRALWGGDNEGSGEKETKFDMD